MPSSEATSTATVLNSQNWTEWEISIRGRLRTKECWDVVSGKFILPAPAYTLSTTEQTDWAFAVASWTDDLEEWNKKDVDSRGNKPERPTKPAGTAVANKAERDEWEKKNEKAMGIIESYIERDQHTHIPETAATAKEYFDALRKAHIRPAHIERIELLQKLLNSGMAEEGNMRDHILRLKKDTRRLFDLGEIDHDIYLVSVILASLPKTYESAKQSLYAYIGTSGFTDAVEHVVNTRESSSWTNSRQNQAALHILPQEPLRRMLGQES